MVSNIFILCFYFLCFFCQFFISYSFAHFLVFTVPLKKYYDMKISFVLNSYPFLNLGSKTDKFLNLSHASFTDLGWANFLTSLAKTDKFLNTSHASFSDLGCSNFGLSDAFFADLGWANFLTLLPKLTNF